MNEPAVHSALEQYPVALLVDGENISAKWAEGLLREARHFGAPTVRRVYGKLEHIADWSDFGFRLQSTRPGKNSADIFLAVEAMSLALRERFHTVILASSDRDFSYVSEHLRELGHHVVGIGEAKSPQSFRTSCSEFIELIEASPKALSAPLLSQDLKLPATKVIPLVRAILPRSSLKDGWAYLDWIEKTLKAADSTFSAATYGHRTFDDLIRAVNFFHIELAANGKPRLRDQSRTVKRVQPPTP
ncbi:MAG: NYN domain-containing protein [Tabrizicola sp.]|uniref:NYN domain-containing protein n=1 Tax=Tabrizicola sp. TaxID=2005166 RepID=UPI0027328CBB|nr:NYN domain-containing protein [Tabrizicola sp.]MDP3262316.1 NYN domain-containing protein [Tabrizicola sp.]MDP3647937.1 NYN domain-containing protein [Paracoccaceae bacterium]MDZ4069949.1 NYN domain-containing protein [Tabrizicola sp.]